jgi:glycine cleavage system H protein
MEQFFITYSHHDENFAKRLFNDLRANGLGGFFAEYSIQPGDDIASKIQAGLEGCDVYIPVLSPAALASKWCEHEISAAINLRNKPERGGRPRIIPAIVAKCEVPALLSSFKWLDFAADYNQALKDLAEAVKGKEEKHGEKAVPPVRPTLPLQPASVVPNVVLESEIFKEVKYSDTHEWVQMEGDLAVIGISDYAQDALGDIVFVELPAVGKTFKAGEAFGVVESVKAASDLYAPLDGTVTEINQLLIETPETVNQDPFGQGWMIKIKLSDPAQFAKLLSAAAYRQKIESGELH